CLAGLLMVLGGSGPLTAKAPPKDASAPKAPAARGEVQALALEVTALQMLAHLDLTPAQLQAVSRMAGDTAAVVKPTTAKVSARFRTTREDLRDALANGEEAKAASLREKLDGLFDEEQVELAD